MRTFALLLALCAAPLSLAQQASFTIITPGLASGVSGDGAVAVGATPVGAPFRWSAAGGLTLLQNPLAPSGIVPRDASNGGAVIVGFGYGQSGLAPARWAPGAALLPLPGWGSNETVSAEGVAANGVLVVGSAVSAELGSRAFTWSAGTGRPHRRRPRRFDLRCRTPRLGLAGGQRNATSWCCAGGRRRRCGGRGFHSRVCRL